jgi:hypothetical protein
MKLRTALLGLSALFIAVAAAYFSVTGLSKLFAGASTEVILMASSLEFGKLISASFLYAYWNDINKLLRTYLLIGVSVLILITSAGIYGFLTSAYQITADQLTVMDKETEVLELKKNRFEEQMVSFQNEREQLTKTISDLSSGLSNNVQTYKDSQGNILTSSSSANRRTLESQLKEARTQRDLVLQKIEVLADSVTLLDIQILGLQQSNELAAEVGPLKYMAEITGKPMNTIVNWFALLIIFVFDPLAVTLVIAFNTALKIDRSSKETKISEKEFKIYGDSKPLEPELGEVMDDMLVDKIGNEPIKKRMLSDGTIWDTVNKFKEDDRFHTSSIDINEPTALANSEYRLGDVDTDFSETPLQPTEELKEIINNQSDGVVNKKGKKKVNTKLSKLKRDFNRRGIDVDGDGIVDGYDTDGDGLINEMRPSSASRWRYVVNEKPYYARNGFDWNDTEKWINNQNAINYYLTYVNPQSNANYPTDFESKTY